MLPPNADPHDYEVRPDDVKALADADLVIRCGGEVDEWLGDAIDASGTDAPELVLADHVDVLDGDPHWWQDPRNAVKATAAIEAALAAADPEGAATYERDAQRYTAALERLDRAVARCIGEIPAGPAHPRHHPRRARLLRRALRPARRRRRDPLALHARPALGGRGRRADRDDRARARPRDLRRVLGQPGRRAGDRRRVGGADRQPRSTPTRSAPRARPAPPTPARSPPTPPPSSTASPAARAPARPAP